MLNFKYTKANGEVSDRSIVSLSIPTTNYFGIDVEDVEVDTVNQLQGLLKRHKKELDEFIAEKELRGNYRSFKAEGMEIVS